jgi:hypothetical protein
MANTITIDMDVAMELYAYAREAMRIIRRECGEKSEEYADVAQPLYIELKSLVQNNK